MLNLERKRIDRNMTQKQTAARVGMTERGYRRIENGEGKPSYEVVVALQNLFGEKIDYLLEQESNGKEDVTCTSPKNANRRKR